MKSVFKTVRRGSAGRRTAWNLLTGPFQENASTNLEAPLVGPALQAPHEDSAASVDL